MKLKLMGLVAMVSTGMSPCVSAAAEKVLHADMRPRPPDMTVDAKTGAGSGPLIEVLNEAAAAIGYTVEWRSAPFARSLEDMKTGAIDVVPRVVLTEERKAFSTFLGPIGAEPIEIKFLVGKGKEDALKSYEDLKKLTVGVKRGTVYFDRFDADTSIRREVGSDDANLVKMFAAGRFDAMIVLDKRSLEGALKEAGVVEYGWAAYKVPLKLEIFYAMPKASPQAAVAERLSAALQKMARSGRVIEIYKKHGVPPPE